MHLFGLTVFQEIRDSLGGLLLSFSMCVTFPIFLVSMYDFKIVRDNLEEESERILDQGVEDLLESEEDEDEEEEEENEHGEGPVRRRGADSDSDDDEDQEPLML